ncbi:MAG: XRE family transcriptional regulator [Agarilytica sp.]
MDLGQQSLSSLVDDRSSKSEQQIAKMSEVHSFSGSDLDNMKILHDASDNEKVLKVFRELRTQLFDKAAGKNFVCMVTSVCPGGGASYAARNLAAAIALDKAKTSVIVDCNFYAPTVDSLLVAEANLGLTDYLSVQEMGIEFVLYASGIKRLRIVPTGKKVGGATEKLSSSKMVGFIQELKARYPDRYIIIDSPSVGDSSADARILAQLCDFVVVVVPYGKVSQSQVKASIEMLGPKRVAGTLFNNV